MPARRKAGPVRSVALLSGGLDSVVATAAAAAEGEVALAITFDYGQRSAGREASAARAAAGDLGVAWRCVALPWLAELLPAALARGGPEPPRPGQGELDDPGRGVERAKAVWVPNRNGVFVNAAAAFAESLGAAAVVAGFNLEEAAAFPDNSRAYMRRATAALALSTLSGVRVVSPTAGLSKTGIARLGIRLGAPLRRVWSCYCDGRTMCGRCEGCARLVRALADGGVPKDRWPPGCAARVEPDR